MQPHQSNRAEWQKKPSRKSLKKRLQLLLFLLTGAGLLRLIGLKRIVDEVLPLLEKDSKYVTPAPQNPKKSRKEKFWDGCLIVLLILLVLAIIGLVLCARAFKN